MLEARAVTVNSGGRLILDDCSLELEAGSVLAVLGQNGAGKSTLVQAVAGNRRLARGSVLLDGREISAWDPIDLARRRAALLQGTQLRFAFSVIEVVLLGRLPHPGGGRSARDCAVAEAALAVVDALHLASRDINKLSGGEQQRVHLARSLAQVWPDDRRSARYLLLDEPTAALDLEHQHRVLRVVRECARNGAAVLVVLHDLNLAARYADRLLVLQEGRCVEEGRPAEVLRPDVLHRRFGIEARVIENPAAPGCPFVIDLGTSDTSGGQADVIALPD